MIFPHWLYYKTQSPNCYRWWSDLNSNWIPSLFPALCALRQFLLIAHASLNSDFFLNHHDLFYLPGIAFLSSLLKEFLIFIPTAIHLVPTLWKHSAPLRKNGELLPLRFQSTTSLFLQEQSDCSKCLYLHWSVSFVNKDSSLLTSAFPGFLETSYRHWDLCVKEKKIRKVKQE